MNKYIKRGVIIGFIFGFLVIWLVQISQHYYCPFQPLVSKNLLLKSDQRNDVCSNNLTTPDLNKKSSGCQNGVYVVRSNCLSSLTFWGYPNDILLIPNIVYAFIYSLVGLLVGYLYGKLKK